jgi:hypothetical protein
MSISIKEKSGTYDEMENREAIQTLGYFFSRDFMSICHKDENPCCNSDSESDIQTLMYELESSPVDSKFAP